MGGEQTPARRQRAVLEWRRRRGKFRAERHIVCASEADFDRQLNGIAAGHKSDRRKSVEQSKAKRLGFSGEKTPQGKYAAAARKYNLSEEEKSDLRKGLKRVIRGKWSEGDFENQIRGIAKSKERR